MILISECRTGGRSFWDIRIPKDLVGAIVGKGGTVIKEISRKTNAVLRLDEKPKLEEERQPRILRIRGRWQNIEMAELEVWKILQANRLQLLETIYAPQPALGLIIGRYYSTSVSYLVCRGKFWTEPLIEHLVTSASSESTVESGR